jgi:beta-carotene hydroxylase
MLGEFIVIDESKIWGQFSGHFAWKTVSLAIVVIVGFFSVLAFAITGVLSLPAAVAINIVLGFLAYTPMHECMHNNIAGEREGLRWIEQAIGWICGFILVGPMPSFRHSHKLHHSNTNNPESDPGCWMKERSPLMVAIKCLTALPYAYVLFFLETDLLAKWKRVGLFLVAAVLAVMVAYECGVLLEVGFAWLFSGWMGVSIAAFLFDWVPHNPYNSTSRFIVARVLHVPGLRWLMVGHNYHLMHHLWPKVPFYHYRDLFIAAQPLLKEKGCRVVTLETTGLSFLTRQG